MDVVALLPLELAIGVVVAPDVDLAVEVVVELDRQAAVRAELIELPGPRMRPTSPGEARPPRRETARGDDGRPPYRLPVMGEVVTGLGEVSDAGIRSRGLTIATRPEVGATTSGRVTYAGDFRDYGQIVILDHGGGWTTLITDLADLDVSLGEEVRQGAPIGRAGEERPTVTIELRRRGQPVDISSLVSRG